MRVVDHMETVTREFQPHPPSSINSLGVSGEHEYIMVLREINGHSNIASYLNL